MKVALIAHQRSGKQFLAACLSNHPDIHCHRDEPLRQLCGLGLDEVLALDYAIKDSYYKVGVCPLTYDQAFPKAMAAYLIENQVAIIHLIRDPLHRATSVILAKNEHQRRVSRHILYDAPFTDDEVLTVPPEIVANNIHRSLALRAQFYALFPDNPRIEVRYEDLSVARDESLLNPKVGRALCEFMDVPYVTLHAPNHKMHKRPLESYYTNWAEIERFLRA